jgi:hypothetical protein
MQMMFTINQNPNGNLSCKTAKSQEKQFIQNEVPNCDVPRNCRHGGIIREEINLQRCRYIQ